MSQYAFGMSIYMITQSAGHLASKAIIMIEALIGEWTYEKFR